MIQVVALAAFGVFGIFVAKHNARRGRRGVAMVVLGGAYMFLAMAGLTLGEWITRTLW